MLSSNVICDVVTTWEFVIMMSLAFKMQDTSDRQLCPKATTAINLAS